MVTAVLRILGDEQRLGIVQALWAQLHQDASRKGADRPSGPQTVTFATSSTNRLRLLLLCGVTWQTHPPRDCEGAPHVWWRRAPKQSTNFHLPW